MLCSYKFLAPRIQLLPQALHLRENASVFLVRRVGWVGGMVVMKKIMGGGWGLKRVGNHLLGLDET